MSFFRFKKKKVRKDVTGQGSDYGILIYENTSEVIRAETILRSKNWKIKVMGPPPEIRTGCDLVIKFPLIEQLNIIRTLEDNGLVPLQIVPVNSPLLKPVDLFNVKDFGKYLMIRAANMKLTIDKDTTTIVNISGGGCPDIPYLASEMIGEQLSKAPSPRKIGHTLCGYALQLAFDEAKNRCLQS